MGVANAIVSLKCGYKITNEGVCSGAAFLHLGLQVLYELLVRRIKLDTGWKPNHVLQ